MPTELSRGPLSTRTNRSHLPTRRLHDRHFPRTLCLLLAGCVLLGCLPEGKAPKIEGPISGNVAAQLQSKMRSKQGNRYTAAHTYQGQEFVAAWELGNALQRSAQLQIKPPSSWTIDDLVAAMQIVLADYKTKPWYAQIDATIVRLLREAANSDDGRAVGVAPETPYEIAVKVKQHSSEWFVEVKVQIKYADGTSMGF